MKKIYNWVIPDYDQHYEKWMNDNDEKTYQRYQRKFALDHVKQFRRAVDVGGNVGFWSYDFCQHFKDVQIFEPDRSNLECIKTNLQQFTNFTAHKVALGNEKKEKILYTSPTTSGGHSLHKDQILEDNVVETKCNVHLLDDYNFTDVDLIKIDTQGSELEVLQGARNTLIDNNPILNIEIEIKTSQQQKNRIKIIKFLRKLGYKALGRSRINEVVFGK